MTRALALAIELTRNEPQPCCKFWKIRFRYRLDRDAPVKEAAGLFSEEFKDAWLANLKRTEPDYEVWAEAVE